MDAALYTLLSGGGFDPLSLFPKYGATGLYYGLTRSPDLLLPSGLYPFYQDQAGTPVDGNGDSIGLAIDQSEGAALGAELVDPDGWSVNAAWDTTGGVLTGTATGSTVEATSQTTATEQGALYRLEYNPTSLTNIQSNDLLVNVGSSYGAVSITATGLAQAYFVASADNEDLQFRFSGASEAADACVITDISLKKISGNHGLQATAAAKPTFTTGTPNVVRGDGVDDNLLSSLNPSTTMTLIEVGTPDSGSASDVLIGSQPASDGKAYLALSSSGYLAGGVGTQATSTIVDSTSTDIRSVKCGKAIQWNGSTVRLFLKVADGAFAKVYEAAQSGAVNTTIPFRILSLNNNGTSAASADTDTLLAMAISAEVNESDIESTMNHFLNL